MRNYYYCEANRVIYTENEKLNSNFPSGRFELIGKYRNRAEAEAAYLDKRPFDAVINDKRI